MNVEFRAAVLPRELRSLMAFDRKVFPASDCFPRAFWKECEAWWMLVDGRKAGCCAFQHHTGSSEEVEPGSLYVVTTGILPRYRGQGLGSLFKAWQVAYAGRHRFARIVTNSRKRKTAMIALNRKFGFEIVRIIPRYYADPSESAVVMTLKL